MIKNKVHLLLLFTFLFIYSCSLEIGYKSKGDDGEVDYWMNKEARSNYVKNDESVKVGKLDNGLSYYIKNNGYPEDRLELLLVVNTGAFHRGTEIKVNSSREVLWIYTKAPNYLSLLKKKL